MYTCRNASEVLTVSCSALSAESVRVAAVGSPAELCGALAGRVLELTARDLPRVIAAVRRARGVRSVTQLGHRVHVLLEEPDADEAGPRILWELAEAGLEASAEIAEPNLEDVFVAVTCDEPAGPPSRS